jgi:hypothetical protein
LTKKVTFNLAAPSYRVRSDKPHPGLGWRTQVRVVDDFGPTESL